MKRSALAGRSHITIVNGTRCAVWVAIYKRSSLREDQSPIAWQVVSPPLRGKTTLFVSQEVQVCARYSCEPDKPRRPVHQTRILQVPHAPAGAGFVIESVSSPDRRSWGAVPTQISNGPGECQIRVANRCLIGVSIHVRMDGRDLFPPPIVPPMAAWTEDLSSPFYIAVLPLPRVAGDLLPDSEISLTEIAVRVGESVRVHGGPVKGFKISRTSADDSRENVETEKPIFQPNDKLDTNLDAS